MKRTRTNMAVLSAVALVAGLTGCRGGDDDADEVATDDDATEQTTDAGTTDTTTADAGADGTDTTAADAGTDTTTATSEATEGTGDGSDAPPASECPATTPGLTDTSIELGGTYPLSGPAAAYSAIPIGVDAWFQHLNDQDGGFQLADGSTVEITWNYLDDGYAPPKALENVKRLVEQDEVFLVLNPLGTPNNTAIRDYMNQQEVPQLMVATGASKWGKEIEQYPWTIGYQPDYESEGIAYAQYILEQNPEAKVGVLYQNDDFGKDYLVGIKEGLGDKADQIVSEVSYEVTAATVDNQVSQIQSSGADALILIVTPKFAVQALQRTAALGWIPDQYVISNVSSSVGAVLAPAGVTEEMNVITTAYIKDPTDPALVDDPAIIEYKEVLAEYHSDADPDDGFHLYGVNLAQNFEALIESIEGPVCRQSIMDAVKNFTFDADLTLEGIEFETSEGDGFPLQQMQLQRFDGETYVKFGEILNTASAG